VCICAIISYQAHFSVTSLNLCGLIGYRGRSDRRGLAWLTSLFGKPPVLTYVVLRTGQDRGVAMDGGQDEASSLRCDICGQQFNRRNTRNQHKRNKHPDAVKKYANLSDCSPEEREERTKAQEREASRRYRARKRAEKDQVRVIRTQSPRVLI
jgi:hypothetical protein